MNYSNFSKIISNVQNISIFNFFGLGLFRTLLAISIVMSHSGSIFNVKIMGGQYSVESFFMISGFLMALILTKKYHSNKKFIINRFLRLFPTYFIVCIITIVISFQFFFYSGNGIVLNSWIYEWKNLNINTLLILIFTNLVIYGQDFIMFLGINSEGVLFFTTNFWDVDLPAYRFLLIPQAWSIGIELTFYLIAPFLTKMKTKYLILIIGSSLAMRLFFYTHLGLSIDPWTYRFFPFELIFFILGIISFRFHQYIEKMDFDPKKFIPLGVLLFIFTFTFNFIPIQDGYKFIIFSILLCTVLPLLFFNSNQSSLDKKMGNYSYPIYIGHWLIILILNALTVKQLFGDTIYTLSSISISILFAGLLYHYIEKPIEKIRKNIANNQ